MTAQRILFPLILSATMSFIISEITTLKAVGPVQNFFSLWYPHGVLRGYLLSQVC